MTQIEPRTKGNGIEVFFIKYGKLITVLCVVLLLYFPIGIYRTFTFSSQHTYHAIGYWLNDAIIYFAVPLGMLIYTRKVNKPYFNEATFKNQSNVSTRLASIDYTFKQVRAAVDNKLSARGYKIIEEKYYPESFGSRYVIWSNKKDAARLIWNGKDEWFILETTYTPPFDWTAKWKEIVHIPYLREHNLEYAGSIPNKIVSGLGAGE